MHSIHSNSLKESHHYKHKTRTTMYNFTDFVFLVGMNQHTNQHIFNHACNVDTNACGCMAYHIYDVHTLLHIMAVATVICNHPG